MEQIVNKDLKEKIWRETLYVPEKMIEAGYCYHCDHCDKTWPMLVLDKPNKRTIITPDPFTGGGIFRIGGRALHKHALKACVNCMDIKLKKISDYLKGSNGVVNDTGYLAYVNNIDFICGRCGKKFPHRGPDGQRIKKKNVLTRGGDLRLGFKVIARLPEMCHKCNKGFINLIEK